MKVRNKSTLDSASFRDPSGCVFERDGRILRQVNTCYQEQYEYLIKSGLYKSLSKKGLLINHTETDEAPLIKDGAYKILLPEKVPYISYPYEWSFGQLKDAALATLAIHKEALQSNMILKDASAYNIQFMNGKAVLIDSLSFDFYQEGAPWIAYGQFCRHFLAPLLLMAKIDIRLNLLLRLYIDGIPLDLADTLLHGKGGFFGMQHIHWHANAMKQHAQDGKSTNVIKEAKISKFQHIALIDSLIRGIKKLSLKNVHTEWADYYDNTNYVEHAKDSKTKLVQSYLEKIKPNEVWALGGNDGRYSELALYIGARSVVAFDIDPIAVERNYQKCKKTRSGMLPLVLDITNPSPGIGFANQERKKISDRQKPDCVMALALIHHLAISNNVPLVLLAKWFSELSYHLIIEFVPKEDSQVKLLLATRKDIFSNYTTEGFEKAFSQYFKLKSCDQIEGSKRYLYHFITNDTK